MKLKSKRQFLFTKPESTKVISSSAVFHRNWMELDLEIGDVGDNAFYLLESCTTYKQVDATVKALDRIMEHCGRLKDFANSVVFEEDNE